MERMKAQHAAAAAASAAVAAASPTLCLCQAHIRFLFLEPPAQHLGGSRETSLHGLTLPRLDLGLGKGESFRKDQWVSTPRLSQAQGWGRGCREVWHMGRSRKWAQKARDQTQKNEDRSPTLLFPVSLQLGGGGVGGWNTRLSPKSLLWQGLPVFSRNLSAWKAPKPGLGSYGSLCGPEKVTTPLWTLVFSVTGRVVRRAVSNRALRRSECCLLGHLF